MEKDSNTRITDREARHLMNLMDLSDCAMFIARQEPSIEVLYANKRFYSMLQYPPDEFDKLFGNQFIEVLLPEEKQKVKSLIARQSAAGGLLQLEFRVANKDGLVRWLSLTAETVRVEEKSFYYCSCMDITQQKRALEEIYNAKKEVDLITNSVPGGVIKLKMSDFTLLYANDGFFRLTGYSRTEYLSLFGNHCDQVIFPDDADLVKRMARTAVENRGALGFEYRIIAKNGEVRWSYVNGCRVDDMEGSAVYLCIIVDITTRKQLEEKLEEEARRSKYFADYMQVTEWTYRTKEQHLSRNGYLGKSDQFLLDREHMYNEHIRKLVHPDDVEELIREFEKLYHSAGSSQGIYRVKEQTGNYRDAEINMISVCYSGESGEPDVVYGQTRMLKDDSYILKAGYSSMENRNSVYKKIETIAKEARSKSEDDVTGLMSQDLFVEEVEKKLKKRSEELHYGIVCCDINSFRVLNYHYGISVGNDLLLHLGQTLRDNLALDDLCTRISADYFMAFFEYNEHSELAKRLSRMLRLQSEWEEKQSYSTDGVICGIYLLKQEDHNVEKMLEKADLARRSIKGTKGSHYAIYTEELQKSHFWEEEVIREIEKAMDNHSVEIFYLPRIRDNRENVIGCKSIPRVLLKDGDYLSLENLRRYLDRSEAVQQMVFYVLSNVCKNMSAWKAKGKKILPVSVDITSGQLCMQRAVDKLDEIVKSNHLTPHDIIFEIQEPYLGQTTSKLQNAIKDLSQRGYRVAISRFASDHTDIHALRYLPISIIKFHGEFFNQTIKNEREKIVFRKIVEMAEEMGLIVGCGGIQTRLQEEIARSMGCNIFEGELYYGAVSNDIYEKCFLEEE